MAASERNAAAALLATARLIGDRAAEAGDAAGCYEVFACAARLLVAVQNVDAEVKEPLARALALAEVAEPEDQAGVLRDAFDELHADAPSPDLPDDPLRVMQTYIAAAISIGAPAYNAGDRRGCYEVYACTARMLLETTDGADDARGLLRAALVECKKYDDTDDQAWAMRRAFDKIGELSPAEPTVGLDEVRMYLAMAIRIGAPAYNAGDHRGCYEVYACTARLLIPRLGDDHEDTRQSLTDALTEAAVLPSVTRQAWVMRAAFDAILDGGE